MGIFIESPRLPEFPNDVLAGGHPRLHECHIIGVSFLPAMIGREMEGTAPAKGIQPVRTKANVAVTKARSAVDVREGWGRRANR